MAYQLSPLWTRPSIYAISPTPWMMIAAGAAGIHYEDQLASEKKCGHLGGKVLVPTAQHIRTLNAARLAADIAARSRGGARRPLPQACSADGRQFSLTFAFLTV